MDLQAPWQHHASSSTRLFPVEMSRARKSSEAICPVRFCGAPHHSRGQGGRGSGWDRRGDVRLIQVRERRSKMKMEKKKKRWKGAEEGEWCLGRGGKKIKSTVNSQKSQSKWTLDRQAVGSAQRDEAAWGNGDPRWTNRSSISPDAMLTGWTLPNLEPVRRLRAGVLT